MHYMKKEEKANRPIKVEFKHIWSMIFKVKLKASFNKHILFLLLQKRGSFLVKIYENTLNKRRYYVWLININTKPQILGLYPIYNDLIWNYTMI